MIILNLTDSYFPCDSSINSVKLLWQAARSDAILLNVQGYLNTENQDVQLQSTVSSRQPSLTDIGRFYHRMFLVISVMTGLYFT